MPHVGFKRCTVYESQASPVVFVRPVLRGRSVKPDHLVILFVFFVGSAKQIPEPRSSTVLFPDLQSRSFKSQIQTTVSKRSPHVLTSIQIYSPQNLNIYAVFADEFELLGESRPSFLTKMHPIKIRDNSPIKVFWY